jgi:hypothetical protein
MKRSHPVTAMAVLLAAACAPKEVPVAETQGDCGAIYTGQVCTFAKLQGDSLLEAGAMVPIAMIDSAPAMSEMAWPPAPAAKLKLPEGVHGKGGLAQLTVFWESMGHPPAFFATPHFDFHFYVVPAGEEMGYDCKDLSKPASIAAGYVLPDIALPPELGKLTGVDTLVGLCVPTMGMHALLGDAMTAEGAMTGQMVIGYYAGKPIFIEPMVSKAMLLEKKSFDLPIPTIPGITGNYPRTFRAEWNEQLQAYRFVFSGFAPAD